METYTFLRELADSWVLLLLTLFFLGVWVWAFRPGSRPIHDDAAKAPFRHDDMSPTGGPSPRGPQPEGGK
ncbi:MAG: cbb3-type cytochrome c oxidase subunit 3 [Pseudomonadota bacterium]